MSTSFVLNGFKRPLPPPENRETVVTQARCFDEWVTTDGSEDLLICPPTKRTKLSNDVELQLRAYCDIASQDGPGGHKLSDLSHRTDWEEARRALSPQATKKRLFVGGAPKSWVPQTRDVGQLAEVDKRAEKVVDYGVNERQGEIWQQRESTNNKEEADSSVESDLEESLRLARATNIDFVSTPPSTSTSTSSDEHQLDAEREMTRAGLSFEQLDTDVHNLSRRLREKALDRRSNAGNSTKVHKFAEQQTTGDESVDCEVATSTDYARTGFAHIRKQHTPLDNHSSTVSSEDSTVLEDIERVFAIAKGAATPADKFNSFTLDSRSIVASAGAAGHHPASRVAAELYRTQSRHLSNGCPPQVSNLQARQDLEDGENRLRLLTSQNFKRTDAPGAISLKTFLDHGENVRSAPEGKHQIPWVNAGCSPSVETLIEDGTRAHEHPPASSTTTEYQNDTKQSSTTELKDVQASDSDMPQPESRWPKYPPLYLERSSQNKAQPVNQPDEQLDVIKEFVLYPETPFDLCLPDNYEGYDEETRKLIEYCEIAKERLRDLEAIIPTFEQIARLGTLDQLGERERSELQTVQEYTKQVLINGLSGKKARKRIGEIRENMKRRIQKHSPPEEIDHAQLLNAILKEARRDYIKQLIRDAQSKLERLRMLRRQVTNKRYDKSKTDRATKRNSTKKKSKQRRHVHFDFSQVASSPQNVGELPSGSVLELPRMADTNGPTLTVTERKRNAQLNAQDKRMQILRANLKLFEKTPVNEAVDSETSGHNPTEVPDDASVTSEETEGAQHFTAPTLHTLCHRDSHCLRDVTANDVSFSVLDESELEQLEQPTASSSQASHDGLVSKIQKRQSQNIIHSQQNVQHLDLELLSINRNKESIADAEWQETNNNRGNTACDPEFRDLLGESSSDEATCYRYLFKSMCVGVPGYEDYHEYVEKFLDLAKAHNELQLLYEELERWYGEHLEPTASSVIGSNSMTRDGLVDKQLHLGPDGRISCRLWIEREEYSPSDEAYKHARVRRACHAKPVYTVFWERTITPGSVLSTGIEDSQADTITQEAVTGSIHNTLSPDVGKSNNTDEDDLFGPEPPPITTNFTEQTVPNIPLTTTIQADALRFFTNMASANRQAKDIFMRWYMDHMPGKEGVYYVRIEDDMIEKQLESYGDWTMWEREEDFDVYTETESDDGEADTVKRKKRVRENDRLKVWVAARPVVGPAN